MQWKCFIPCCVFVTYGCSSQSARHTLSFVLEVKRGQCGKTHWWVSQKGCQRKKGDSQLPQRTPKQGEKFCPDPDAEQQSTSLIWDLFYLSQMKTTHAQVFRNRGQFICQLQQVCCISNFCLVYNLCCSLQEQNPASASPSLLEVTG